MMRSRSAMWADAIGPSAILLLLVGCVPPTLFTSDLRPFVATAGAYAVLQAPPPAPGPGVCENCGGDGIVGDGRIAVPCPVCRPQKPGETPCPTGKCPLPTRPTGR